MTHFGCMFVYFVRVAEALFARSCARLASNLLHEIVLDTNMAVLCK